MLDHVQRIYVQHPSRADNLIPAAVLDVHDNRIRVRFLQPAAVPAKKKTQLFYHDALHVFHSIECEVIRMECAGTQPIGSLGLIGKPQRNDQREAFRVGAHGDSFPVQIDGAGQGELINISCTGAAAAFGYDGLAVDSWLNVTLVYDLQPITGRMQVRNWSKLSDGRIRYGFKADPEDGQLLSELSRITQNLQQLKARRASRLSGAARKQTGLNASVDHEDTNAVDAKAPPKALSHAEDTDADGQSKRQHQRKPWNGVAKIYLREEQNLRVLDVSTIDLSPGGLSFASSNYIYQGSELLFEKPIPGGLFRIRGKVRSVHVHAPGKHRVGIQFIGSPLKPGEHAPELESLTIAS